MSQVSAADQKSGLASSARSSFEKDQTPQVDTLLAPLLEGDMSPMEPGDSKSLDPRDHSLISITARPRASMGSACASWCSCRCHFKRSLKSPKFLRDILGSLFLGYSGLPILAPPCNESSCRRRSSPAVDITYYFPFWFLSKVFSVNLSLISLGGTRVLLRVPRQVGWESPLWQLCRRRRARLNPTAVWRACRLSVRRESLRAVGIARESNSPGRDPHDTPS